MSDVPLLLTPGPLTTSEATRAPMAVDYGSRDPAFVAISDRVRASLALMAGPPDSLVAIPLQGSGTFSVEAALGTLVGRHDKILVLVNGAYGRRMVQIAHTIGRDVAWLEWDETEPVAPDEVERALMSDEDITHVAVVYCETTTGLLNPLAQIAEIVARHERSLVIDAMSAFGALPVHLDDIPFDALMASSNKCLEGVPGIGFVLVRPEVLARCEGNCHSLSLDLWAQQQRFAKDGQWRFTPPTHVLTALGAAIDQHAAEGGVAGRGKRYATNHKTLVDGLRGLGFEALLPDSLQAPIITTFLVPGDDAWDFGAFYDALVARGFAIYPGKLTEQETFRVGCIGQVFPEDLKRFVAAVAEVMAELGIESGAPADA